MQKWISCLGIECVAYHSSVGCSFPFLVEHWAVLVWTRENGPVFLGLIFWRKWDLQILTLTPMILILVFVPRSPMYILWFPTCLVFHRVKITSHRL